MSTLDFKFCYTEHGPGFPSTLLIKEEKLNELNTLTETYTEKEINTHVNANKFSIVNLTPQHRFNGPLINGDISISFEKKEFGLDSPICFLTTEKGRSWIRGSKLAGPFSASILKDAQVDIVSEPTFQLTITAQKDNKELHKEEFRNFNISNLIINFEKTREELYQEFKRKVESGEIVLDEY